MAQGKKVEFTPEDLEKLAILSPSVEEVAAVFEVAKRTVQRYLRKKDYSEAYERGKSKRRVSIKRAQYQLAMKGHCAMLIWLGKNELGQSDMPEIQGSEPLPWVD